MQGGINLQHYQSFGGNKQCLGPAQGDIKVWGKQQEVYQIYYDCEDFDEAETQTGVRSINNAQNLKKYNKGCESKLKLINKILSRKGYQYTYIRIKTLLVWYYHFLR